MCKLFDVFLRNQETIDFQITVLNHFIEEIMRIVLTSIRVADPQAHN